MLEKKENKKDSFEIVSGVDDVDTILLSHGAIASHETREEEN